jgi:GT2 family glycosyltransferase
MANLDESRQSELISKISLSVIVPTCERNNLLSQCLDALSAGRQSLASDYYEVIVSDDGSASNALELIVGKYSWVKWVPGPRRGPAANRNHGAGQAIGQWLVFLDDDCVPDRGWLEAIHNACTENVDIVEGQTLRSDNSDHPLKYGIENLWGGAFFSCNLAVKRELFFRLGGFDEDFLEAGGEDMEFAWRIEQLKLHHVFVPKALVLHPVRFFTWRSLLWRAALTRWLLLYRYKTGQAVPLTASDFLAVSSVAAEFSMNLLRTTYQFFRRGPHKYFWGRLFEVIWNLVSFPFLLPYLLIWEIRFRKQLIERQSGEQT